MAKRKYLDGRLAPRSEEGQAGEEQGADEVQHGWAAWPGPAGTSTISR
jgi:hypothetical protein